MVGEKARSSYKRKRKKTFSGRQRQDTDLSASTTTANSDTCETSEDNPSGSLQNIIGTSRKKMQRESCNVDSEFDLENAEDSQEYRVMSLNCLLSALSNMQHVCGEGIAL